MSLWRTLQNNCGRLHKFNLKGFWGIDLNTKDPEIPNLPLFTAFAYYINALVDGIDSAQSEANGWDAIVKAAVKANVAWVVRTSDTVVTITLGVIAGYDITAQEVITATIPGGILTSGNPIVASPTFTIDVLTVAEGVWRPIYRPRRR